jgi:hypothetical protein
MFWTQFALVVFMCVLRLHDADPTGSEWLSGWWCGVLAGEILAALWRKTALEAMEAQP